VADKEKLIRDRVPQIIRAQGDEPIVRIADPGEPCCRRKSSRHIGGRCSRDVDDDARTDVRYVHPPGAKPERELAWREMAVNRPGDCQGPGSV
jgi:hypothetical protein